ncbi:uncharacterized protein LOC108096157 [Drosophila ficusphila]|uniref:uncharacterized protein LOC108096157 n=1 Tax=Drosophila ficusphila TaxID=30025 RepID=UPI0007E808DA|nr:uncharacterized protein LOC108096157 [Drosophila ficusphila]
MQFDKVFFLFFGVLAVVIAATMSAEAQDNDVISDRRFRWDFSQDSDDSANDLQEDDSADNAAQSDNGGKSGGQDTVEIIEEGSFENDPKQSKESASIES